MILYILYLAVLCFLLWKNNFFGLLRTEGIRSNRLSLIFFLKALAVPVFYAVYKKMYGGIENLDAGKFFHDAVIISNYGLDHPGSYLRLMAGLQNDNAGSADFVNLLQYTYNWDNGQLKDFFYNDNRVVIRLHSLFNFICFGSYFAHALLNCFIGFAGLVFLFNTLREFFPNKPLSVLLILCFFPTLWFYSGAVLKENICLFIIGVQVHTFKNAITSGLNLKRVLVMAVLLFASFFIKPYLILLTTCCFALFFLIGKVSPARWQTLLFAGSIMLLILAANLASLLIKQQSLGEAIERHQRVFADMSKGGIFLKDSVKFVRLKYDTTLVKKVQGQDSLYIVKAGVPFTYWEDSHQQDTLYCVANADTLTHYKLAYSIAESKSNIAMDLDHYGAPRVVFRALYFSLFYPLFVNAKGPLQLLASAENALIILALLMVVTGLLRGKKNNFLPVVLLSIALAVCVLAGIATPNSGAIFRYRAPVVIYILLAALYYFEKFFSKYSPTKGASE